MSQNLYRKRRKAFIGLLEKTEGKNCVAVIFSNPESPMSADLHHPYRPSSDMLWLTGLSESNCCLVIDKDAHSTLFVQNRDPKMEQWTGIRLGKEKAAEVIGVDEAFTIDELDTKIVELLAGHDTLCVDLHTPDWTPRVQKWSEQVSALARRKKTHAPRKWVDLIKVMGRLRLVKDISEIEHLKKSQAISIEAHQLAMKAAKPGIFEYQIQAIMESNFLMKGGNGSAYEPIVAGGDNANILHYVTNRDELKDGELLLIDAGCNYQYYASDITRTFPVNGKFTPLQKDVYQLVLASQKAAFSLCRPGHTAKEIHKKASGVLCQGLIDLKVLSGSLDENLEKETHRAFYPHGTGHWLGMDVHDPCTYMEDDLDDVKFTNGMVFTVEPGLYFPSELDIGASFADELKGIGIRIEDDILITESGHENLTHALASEVNEVEELCAQNLSFNFPY